MQSLLDEFNINLKTIEDYIHHIQSVDNLMDNMKSIKHESLLDFTRYYILTEHRYEKIINTFLNQHYLDPITNLPRKTIFYVKNKVNKRKK